MRTLLVIATLLCVNCLADDRITCSDIKKNVAGWLANQLSSSASRFIHTKFYLSTNKHKEPIEIDLTDWSQLVTGGFDVSKRTFMITHGYLSGGQKPWVLEMKDAILDTREGNVIMVDWSDGGNKKNYVNAAKNTVQASNRIFNFFQTLRSKVRYLNSSSAEILYNHLHMIGHSLGAQVCGQTAFLLKKDSYWKIDRITGLDPAKPCFSNVGPSLRLDRQHANFVDVIHTQIGKGIMDAFGVTDPIGHTDFYVNGGMVQPECQGKIIGYDEMICSHKLATKYFIESIRNSKSGNCFFKMQRWNGSYLDADMKIDWINKGMHCRNCPKMGIDSYHKSIQGIFLVLTGTHEPYCNFKGDDDLRKIVPGIRRLKGIKSIFDLREPDKDDIDFLPPHPRPRQLH